MMSDIIAVVVAGLVPTLVGTCWYHPRVFGTAWMRLLQITPETAERAARRRTSHTGISIALGLFLAYIVMVLERQLGIPDASGALLFGAALWLMYAIPSGINLVLWEHRPVQLFAIQSGYWLTCLVFMALVFIL